MDRVVDMSYADLRLERPEPAAEDIHFTEAFVRMVLEEYSAPGDVVLDPFAGYGTTLVVAEALGRTPIGVEVLAERAAFIRRRLRSTGRVIEGDSRRLDELGLDVVDLCLTSPPYMTDHGHPQNPLTGYQTLDGDYATYLAELLDVFLAVARHLRPGGHLVVNAANVRSDDGTITPLAWDLARALRPHLAFRAEAYLRWDHPPQSITGDYCLVFQR